MSSSSDQGKSSTLSQTNQSDYVVPPEQYGPPQSASQKLTPLDMNMPRVYGARWIMCFHLPPGTDKAQVYKDLRTGLAHTIISIPWIAGNIGPEEGSNSADNRVQIVDSSDGVKFPFKDLTGVLPSYEDLEKDGFPLSKLSTEDLGPIGVLPTTASPPVLAAQANFLENGLLLTVGVHHAACDASSLEDIVSTWAHNTEAAGGSLSFMAHDPLSSDRSPLMERTPGANIADFPEYKIDTQPQAGPPPGFQFPAMSSRVFHFSPESLAGLKASAAAFSTHDALCAFLWRQMTLARRIPGVSPDPPSSEERSALAFAVNIRGRASPPLPPTYMGNASMLTITDRLPASAIILGDGLPRAAAAVRNSLGVFGSPARVPLTIGLLASRPDPTDFRLAYHAFLGPDVVATSWADLKVYEKSWGALGTVGAFRVPGEGADGMIMILPRLRDGGLEVVVGLELGAMERLLEADEFAKATGR
ncbi:related to trichothecene 3-O-acetyltransferase [Cephalotrichum gorgonifer]|uniref:Related to trichothecene 3-O-acetyltransferase n=1 Tax=Cephalotrichum gorgonifer TaxID=2041049 RepID=A0AAE8MY68_9PEZI|nr:related to trichothecene 3-O-acetyltransferase [Cephalotrichum gorgonifer]